VLLSSAKENLKGKGRFNAPFLFIAVLILLNAGVYLLLSPEQRLVTSLPFGLSENDNWQVVSGTWQWQQGSLEQTSQGSALMVSPFRLTGQARHIKVQLEPNSGLSFVMQKGNKLMQSHVVYRSDQELIAAFVTEQGQFVKQASVPITGDDFRLSIRLKASHYDLILNQYLVAEDLTLNYHTGALGLITEGPSQVKGLIIDSGVDSLAQAINLPQVDSFHTGFPIALEPEWVAFSGAWHIDGGKLYQTESEGFNHSLVIPQTRVATKIETRFEELEGSGSGIAFHLPSTTSLTGGHLVRLAENEGEQLIFWGYFDETKGFVGQGASGLAELSKTAINLTILLEASSYSVFLNGERLASNVPLLATGKHVALSSSESKAAFDLLKLEF